MGDTRNMTGDVIELREKLFLGAALCSALADLALRCPAPLCDQMESLARMAQTAMAGGIDIANAALCALSVVSNAA
jgi:hypothetical protein